jgi:hypothetical protein
MMKAVYDIYTQILIVTGDNIQTLVTIITEMGEWNSVNDLEGNPLYDIQLDFDDSIDEGTNTELNVDNYNLQYVNLIPTGDKEYPLTSGTDWRNAELTIIKSKPHMEVLGIKGEPTYTFEGKEYVEADQFEDGGVVISKGGKTITRLYGCLGRENWKPLKLKRTYI